MDISPAVYLAWQIGCHEAIAAKKDTIDPVQFFIGMMKIEDILNIDQLADILPKGTDRSVLQVEIADVMHTLRRNGVDPAGFRRSMRKRAGIGHVEYQQGQVMHRSDSLRSIFDEARIIADQMRSPKIHLNHICLALLQNRNLIACRVLSEKGIDPTRLAEAVRASQKQNDIEPRSARKPDTFLARFGRDLTELARQGRLSPAIGRRHEVLLLIQTLSRHSKNNPILIGEPGVGKTAIVEILASRIAAGKDAHVLNGKRIIEISMSAVLAGSQMRGAVEERLNGIVHECAEQPEIILFFDEIHSLMTSGGVSGGVNPADILKPALARGDIRCIGATTMDEYARHIQSDAALDRRFDKIFVSEPGIDETVEILLALKPEWTRHHQVRISEEILRTAVDLAVRFDGQNQCPDKVIDLIDKACAKTRLPQLSFMEDRSLASDGHENNILALTESVLVETLAEKLNLPAELMFSQLRIQSTFYLEGMQDALNHSVIGQKKAVQRICNRLQISLGKGHQRHRPLGVFLFVGASGVGKTLMAKTMARHLFDENRRSLIRLDMSEFMQEHSVARLIGAPPGYIGYGDPGQLTDKLRTNPHAIVLLDEIEKAHPRILDLFLQLFDEGRLSDAKGRVIDARHAIFIMTANTVKTKQRVGFNFAGNENRNAGDNPVAIPGFRPEFMNRIDEKIIFKTLDMDDARTIVRRHLGDLAAAVRHQSGHALQFEEDVIDYIVTQGFSEQYGARELNRLLENVIELSLDAYLARIQSTEPLVIVAAIENSAIVYRADATLGSRGNG